MNLLEQCKSVLEKNWKGKFTIPSPRLYPFQWNWDSGFIAVGNLHVNPEHAILEMETLFSGQWQNGFLPHILFHNEEKYDSYFPSADYWNSRCSALAPKELKTSGITQPPVHGFVLEFFFNHGFEESRLIKLFNKVVEYHKYLYSFREYKNTGLTVIWHNWESGMDNSVWWDSVLNRISESEMKDIQLFRKDVHEVKESDKTRPEDLDYKRYLYLVNRLRNFKYYKVPSDYPFQIIEPVFNTMLLESNASLIRIGERIDQDISFLKSKTEKGLENFSKYLWNNDDALYYPFDITVEEQIDKHCSGSYVPIFAGIPSTEQVEKLITRLESSRSIVPVPSCYPGQKGFQQKNYWRGPVWVNINWIIWKGLLKYGKTESAETIKNITIQLVEKFGIREYFDPFADTQSTEGYGGVQFSWTAALMIDMIRSET